MQYANNKKSRKCKAQQHTYWSVFDKSRYFPVWWRYSHDSRMHRSCLSSWSWQIASDRPKTFCAMNDAHLNLSTPSATNASCISSSRALLNIYTHAHHSCMTLMWQRDVSSHALVTRMLCVNKLNASIDSIKLRHRGCIRSIAIINNECVRAWRHASRDCLSVCLSLTSSFRSSLAWRCWCGAARWRPLLKPSRPQSETAPLLSAPRTICAPLCACAPLSLFTRTLTNQSAERKILHEY